MNSPIWNVTVPAGGTTLIPQNGTQVYFTIITGSVAFRTRSKKWSSQYNQAAAGFGWKDLDFETIELKNLSATNSCVVQVIVGDAGFINNQLVLAASQGQSVAYPTYSAANSASSVLIRDLSGGSFFDINGAKWLAMQRQAIEVFNADSGITLNLQAFSSVVSGGPAVGIIYPLTPLKFEYGGNYTLNLGGSSINAIVTEIYLAIPAT